MDQKTNDFITDGGADTGDLRLWQNNTEYFKTIDREQLIRDKKLDVRIWNTEPGRVWHLKIELDNIQTLLFQSYETYDEMTTQLDNFLRSL
jgi:hypothetical protein